MLFWAGNAVIGRGIHELVPPMTLAWLRWTFATLAILPFAWPHLRRDRAVIFARWGTLLGLGALGCGLFNTLYYYGLGKTPAINALIINSVVPIWYRLPRSLSTGRGLGWRRRRVSGCRSLVY